MTKTLTALAAAATLAVAAVAVPHQAEARWGGWHGGHGFHGAPILGGLAAGAIIGGALAAPYYYGDGPYYAYGGDCWHQRFWTPYGWRWRTVCR